MRPSTSNNNLLLFNNGHAKKPPLRSSNEDLNTDPRLKSGLISSAAHSSLHSQVPPSQTTPSHTLLKRLRSANALEMPIDPHGNTALHLAVTYGDTPLVALLLSKGADPNVQNAAGISPLDMAKISESEHIKATATVIARFGCLDAEKQDRPLPQLPPSDIVGIAHSVHKMALLGQIRRLGFNHRDINAQLQDGTTPLMHAAVAGHSLSIQKLLDDAADPLILDHKGFSALAWAAAGGWIGAVSLLLTRTPNLPVKPSTSPLVIAAFFGHAEVVALLIKADMPLVQNALLVAAWMKHSRIVSTLIQAASPIPQPFTDWLSHGTRYRTDWEAQTFFHHKLSTSSSHPNAPSSGSSLPRHSSADLAALEIERILTLATPESALTSGKALIKSVPTKTAHAATSGLHAELSSSPNKNSKDCFFVKPGCVPLFRRSALSKVLPGPPSEVPQFDFNFANDSHSKLSAAILHKIPVIGTELDIICGSIGVQLIELLRRVQSADKGKYTGIVVSIANHVQSLQTIIDTVPHQQPRLQLLEHAQIQLNHIQAELLPSAMKHTRLAEGVWPTPTAENDMLGATEKVFSNLLNVVSTANAAGVWPLGRINVPELISGCTTPMSAASAVTNGVSFEQYRRANRLHAIDTIAQHNSQNSIDVGSSSLVFNPPPEEHPDDLNFSCNVLDPMLKKFVAAVRALYLASHKDEKNKYIDLSHEIVSTCDHIMDLISGNPLMQQAAITELVFSDDTQVSDCISSARKEVRLKGIAIIQRAKCAAGVWPPADAVLEMIDALLNAGAAVRRFVIYARKTIVLVRSLKAAEIARDEERRRMWMHGEQVRKMFSIWESIKDDTKVPSETASLVLKDKRWLSDPSDGLVFQSGQIRGGRLVRLVERATYCEKYDEVFIKAFLMTHHSFTTSHYLMAVLVKRYDLGPPLGIEDEETFRAWVEHKLVPVRTGVLAILALWVSHYCSDFLCDSHSLLVKLREFLSIKAAPDFPIKVGQISALLAKQLAALDHKEKEIDPKKAPKPIIGKAIDALKSGYQHVIDVDVTEIARQWTLIESKFFRVISNKEWINQIWGRANEASRTKAPNIDHMIKFTNKITMLVASMVVGGEKEKHRLASVKYWVHVAQACAELNNYNAVTAVIAGLKMGPVRRLDKLWASFGTKHPKSSQIFNRLSDTVSTSGQYLNYRKLLKSLEPPCVPFLGVYITDLTFIEDGNPDYLSEGVDHLINFEKRRKVACIIEEIATFQSTCYYHLHTVPKVESFLINLPNLSNEADLYSQSVKVEPILDDSDDE